MPDSLASTGKLPANLTRDLAGWISGFDRGELPAAVQGAMRRALLDTLGVGLHGQGEEWAGIAREWAYGATAPDSDDAATIWGEEEALLRTSDAAFVNGIAAHAFELDDFCQKLHPGAVVIPAAMAVAQANTCNLGQLLGGIAVGYETMIRLSMALDPNQARLRGWHLTGVCGPVGAAAAASWLLWLGGEETAWAIGLGATQGSGLFAFNADGAMSKRFHPGRAAQSGVMAAELAARGFSGPTKVLETDDGSFLTAFSDHADGSRLLDGLGQRWELLTNNFKPYSCCGSVHAYNDCAIAIRNRLGRAPLPGERVVTGLPKVVDVQCGYPYAPGTALFAQMSARYCIAVALLDGAVLPDQFTDERMRSPDVVDLAQRIEIVGDERLDALYPAQYPGWVEVHTADGVVREDRDNPSGAHDSPDYTAGLLAKYDALLGERGQRLKALVLDGPGETPVQALLEAMARP
ncbi:MAG: MmgE/PrpD family protein [Alphaproteobacteria bacterium]|nr:MmgE/PrpD family protein [Alphaproteobacteria bacterium]MCB9931337.1 MmgE/PrpD family protein [Alphaproteobacteria bacterium]